MHIFIYYKSSPYPKHGKGKVKVKKITPHPPLYIPELTPHNNVIQYLVTINVTNLYNLFLLIFAIF